MIRWKWRGRRWASGTWMSLRFFFLAKRARASSLYPGATMTSKKSPPMALATRASTGRLKATMPPKMLTGSAAYARA